MTPPFDIMEDSQKILVFQMRHTLNLGAGGGTVGTASPLSALVLESSPLWDCFKNSKVAYLPKHLRPLYPLLNAKNSTPTPLNADPI